METIEIRKATDNDAISLQKIKPILFLGEIKTRLGEQNKGLIDYLILESNGQPVAFVVLKWRGKETHPEYPDMSDLYTKDEERGKGYGTKLIIECERIAKEKGCVKIGLAVNPKLNSLAKKLYERLGYKHDGGKPYIDGIYDGTEDWCIDLEKKL